MCPVQDLSRINIIKILNSDNEMIPLYISSTYIWHCFEDFIDKDIAEPAVIRATVYGLSDPVLM